MAFEDFKTNPVRISPTVFWSLVVCLVLCVLICLYVIIFRTVQTATLSPTYATGLNTSKVVDNGSYRCTGQGTKYYSLNMQITPSTANVWGAVTVTPDSIFNSQNIIGTDVYGVSSIDGTTTTTPAEILQIIPVASGNKLTVNYFTNSVYTHWINLQFHLK